MSIWTREGQSSYAAVTGTAPGYLEHPRQRQRWLRLRMAKMLFEGKHRQFFLEEGRTQFGFRELLLGDRLCRVYMTLNLLKLMSVKTADLMFGAKVKLDAPTQVQRDELDNLVRRSRVHSRLHGAVVDASWAGGSFLAAITRGGRGYLELIPPEEIYPDGPAGPDDQYERYLRYATADIGTPDAPDLLLLETIYEPGRIERRAWRIDRQGAKGDRVDLSAWPAFENETPPDEQRLGIDENPITFLPNEAGGVTDTSDYDGLIEFQDAVNAKFSQVAVVLAKHADPKLAMSVRHANDDGDINPMHDVFFTDGADTVPQYITWDGELESAMKDRDAAISAFCMEAEMSQVLLGIKGGATPDAARKLRLEATNTLAKVGRKANAIEPAVARALEVALKLEQTMGMRRFPVEPIGVEMRDGLPVDELDEAQAISLYRSGKVMSLEAAVERRVEDPDAAFTEVERIKKEMAEERAAMIPPIMFGEPAGEVA